MCGIAGFIGKDVNFKAYDFIKHAHETLSYRGYDSNGILGISPDKNITIKKTIGKQIVDISNINFTNVLYHNRWATHGNVTEENTHPIQSFNKRYIIVHNGIVENWKELAKTLDGIIPPEHLVTDTMVLVNYLSMQNSIETEYPVGKFAYILYDTLFEEFILYTNGMPLYITPKGYVSSDLRTLQKYDNKYYKLLDKEYIYSNTYSKLKWINMDINNTEIYDNTMLTEINQQPNLIDSFDKSFDICIDEAVGCGSSYYAALYGEKLYNTFRAKYASESQNEGDVLAISQSAETKDVIDFLKNTSYNTYLLTNNPNGFASTLVNRVIDINAGPEFAVASTKTFMLFCLWFLLGYIPETEKERIKSRISNKLREILSISSDFSIYNKYKNCNFIILGTGLSYPIALEGALKIKEVANCWCDAMPAAEIKHGPISLIDRDVVSIVMFTGEKKKDLNIQSNIEQIKSRGGIVLVIQPNKKLSINETEINLGLIIDYELQFAQALCFQLIAYNLAIAKGLDPDKPRYLSKAITV